MVCSLWVSVVIELGRGGKIGTESRKSCIQIRPFLDTEAFQGQGIAVWSRSRTWKVVCH